MRLNSRTLRLTSRRIERAWLRCFFGHGSDYILLDSEQPTSKSAPTGMTLGALLPVAVNSADATDATLQSTRAQGAPSLSAPERLHP